VLNNRPFSTVWFGGIQSESREIVNIIDASTIVKEINPDVDSVVLDIPELIKFRKREVAFAISLHSQLFEAAKTKRLANIATFFIASVAWVLSNFLMEMNFQRDISVIFTNSLYYGSYNKYLHIECKITSMVSIYSILKGYTIYPNNLIK
jgi:hypothetical protein